MNIVKTIGGMSRHFESIARDPKNRVFQSGIFDLVNLQSQDRNFPEIFASHSVTVCHVFLSQLHEVTYMSQTILAVITMWQKLSNE